MCILSLFQLLVLAYLVKDVKSSSMYSLWKLVKSSISLGYSELNGSQDGSDLGLYFTCRVETFPYHFLWFVTIYEVASASCVMKYKVINSGCLKHLFCDM